MIFHSERFRRLSKEGSWIIFGQVASIAGALFGVRLITEVLDPASYGKLSLALTVATLINQTVVGPLGNGITRFYFPASMAEDLGGYFKAVKNLTLSATWIIFLIILLAVVGLLIAGKTEWIVITISAFIFALLSGYSSILTGIQNAARQRSLVAIFQGIEPFLRFLITAGLLLWVQDTTTMAITGYALATLILILAQFFFFRRNINTKSLVEEDSKTWKDQIWKYSWPFATWGIFSWAQTASDRWALGYFASTKDLGHYAVLFQLGYYPMSMASGLAMQFLAPIFYQRMGIANKDSAHHVNKLSWRITWSVLGMTALGVVFLLLFHSLIFRIFVSQKYASVSYLLPWMLLAGGIFAAAQTIALNLMSQMKTHSMTVVKIVTSILGIIFNFIGAYFYGVPGVIAASITFSVVYFIWMVVISKDLTGGIPSMNLSNKEL